MKLVTIAASQASGISGDTLELYSATDRPPTFIIPHVTALATARGGVRRMMRTHGVILAIGVAVTLLFPVSKFHLLWLFPVAFIAPVFLMGGKETRFRREFQALVDESKRTGVPLQQLVDRETRLP